MRGEHSPLILLFLVILASAGFCQSVLAKQFQTQAAIQSTKSFDDALSSLSNSPSARHLRPRMQPVEEKHTPHLVSGDFWERVKVGSVNRDFIVHVPVNMMQHEKHPVVLAFHGGGGTARNMAKVSKLNEIADKYHILVVYPDSVQKHWNDGRAIKGENADDVGFVSSMIWSLTAAYNADPKRIYATGISNGGFFVQRLGLEIPDKLAAIAVVDAGLTNELKQLNGPDRPISSLFILGTSDPLVPFNGGRIASMFGGRGKVAPASETIKFWIDHNNCNPIGQSQVLSPRAVRDSTRVQQVIYQPADRGKTVTEFIVKGGGHTWPSGQQYLPRAIIGKTTRQLSNDDIWNFFKDKHLD